MAIALTKPGIDLGIVTGDGDAALRFYRDTLGFRQEPDTQFPGGGTMHLSGLNDSQVSSHVARKGSSTTFPLCVVAMELPAQLEHLVASLDLLWNPPGPES